MPTINLIIRSPYGVFTLEDVSLAWTVTELKAAITMRMNRNRSIAFGGGEPANSGVVSGGRVTVDSLRLISRGRVLNDDQTIATGGMTENQTIHVVVRGGGVVTSPVSPTAPTSTQIGGQGLSGTAAAPADNNANHSHTAETEDTLTEASSLTAEAEAPASTTDTDQRRENENNSKVTAQASGAERSQASPDGERAASLPLHTDEVAPESSSTHAANADQTEAQSRSTCRPPQAFDANRIPPELAAGINIFLSGLTNSFGGSWATASQGTNANATNAAPTPFPSPFVVNSNNNTNANAASATSARGGNTTTTPPPANTPSAGFDPSALLVGALPLMNSMLGNIRLAATAPAPSASSPAHANNCGSTTPTRQTDSSGSTSGAQPNQTAAAGDAIPRADTTNTKQQQRGGEEGQGTVENVTAANPETCSAPTADAPITNSIDTNDANTATTTTTNTTSSTATEAALTRSPSAVSCTMGSAAGILEAIANSVTAGILPIFGVGVASTAAAVTNLTRAPSPASTAIPSLLPFSPQQLQQSLLSGLASGLQSPATQTAILAAIPAGIAAINGLAGAARGATVASSAAAAYPAATMGGAAAGGASALSLSGLGSFAGLTGLAGLGLASLTSLASFSQPSSTTQSNNNNNNNAGTNEPPKEAGARRGVSSSTHSGNTEQQSTTVHHHYYYNNAGQQGNAPHHQPPTAAASAAGPTVVRVQLSVSASELAEVPSALERYRGRLTEERSRAQHQQSLSSPQGSSEAAGSNGSERINCDVVVNASLRDLDSLPSAVARLEAELGLRTSEDTAGIDVSEVAPQA